MCFVIFFYIHHIELRWVFFHRVGLSSVFWICLRIHGNGIIYLHEPLIFMVSWYVRTYTIPMDLSYGIKTFFFGAELFSLPGKTSSSTLQNLMRICNSWFLGFKSNRMLCWNIVPFSSLFYVCELLPPPQLTNRNLDQDQWSTGQPVASGLTPNGCGRAFPKTTPWKPSLYLKVPKKRLSSNHAFSGLLLLGSGSRVPTWLFGTKVHFFSF